LITIKAHPFAQRSLPQSETAAMIPPCIDIDIRQVPILRVRATAARRVN